VAVGASRQALTDGASHFGESHLDAQTAVRAKLSFQALILLTSNHGRLLLVIGFELDEGSVALEHLRIVPRTGMNLLRLYWPAVAHSVETETVDLGGQVHRPHLVLRRSPQHLSHRTVCGKRHSLRRWRRVSQGSEQPLCCGKTPFNLGGLGPLLFKKTPVTVDP
jgi:hypothetical protein